MIKIIMKGLKNAVAEIKKNRVPVVAAASLFFGTALGVAVAKITNSGATINNNALNKNNCFHPETKLKLKNGTIVAIKDLNLGDILENGGRVDDLIKVYNKYNDKYYIIPKKGVYGEDIYVTGSQMIFDNLADKYVQVKNHPDAIQTDVIDSWFCGFISDNHKMMIGEQLFLDWDWEDDIFDNLKKKSMLP